MAVSSLTFALIASQPFRAFDFPPPPRVLRADERLTVAALSGAIAQAAIYPLEVVQTRLAATHGVYNGIMDVIGSLWQKEGGRAFYRYASSCLMRYVDSDHDFGH